MHKVLLYFKKNSRYAPPVEGEFRKCPEFDNCHVYKGRLLSVDEFNAIDGTVFKAGRYSQVVRIRIVEVETEPTVEPTEPTVEPTEPTVEHPKKKSSRRPRKAE